MSEELKPCPFCGKCPEIAVCDNEGNVRGEDYERDPWSGLGYRIVHISEDCPVATDEDGGRNIYDTREEAERHWNRRAERTCRVEVERRKLSQTQTAVVKTCSGCGFEFGVEKENTLPFEVTLNVVVPPTFCQNCGARVEGASDDADR